MEQKTKADRMILGENAVYSMDCHETGLNNNVIVAGCSGSGKTMSVAAAALLEAAHNSMIVTMTKSRIGRKYWHYMQRKGYDCEILDFAHPELSTIGYDPLHDVHSETDITFLSQSIVKANPLKDKSNADPYWDDAATSLLSALIGFVWMTEKNPGMADVWELFHSLGYRASGTVEIETDLDEEFEGLERLEPTCFAVSCWKSFRSLPPRTAGCVFCTLSTAMDKIFVPQLLQMMSMPRSIDFKQLATRKTVVFVMTSAVNPALHSFVNIFYSQAIKTLFEYAEEQPDGMLPIPVQMLCDDFATGSRVLNFPEYISIFREKQISVTLLIQSESQLESMYGPTDAVTIINNCDTYIYMGGMDLHTCRSVSERLNVPLEEVLYMPVGTECIFRRGQQPLVTGRYNILNDSRYQQVTREYEKRGGRDTRG